MRRERARYYPQFCSLGWLANEADAQRFADFVRETRQVHNQFLHLIGNEKTAGKRAIAFTRLKKWQERWQERALEYQLFYAQLRGQASEAWPESLLAAAWSALLPGNPRLPPIKNKRWRHCGLKPRQTGAASSRLASACYTFWPAA